MSAKWVINGCRVYLFFPISPGRCLKGASHVSFLQMDLIGVLAEFDCHRKEGRRAAGQRGSQAATGVPVQVAADACGAGCFYDWIPDGRRIVKRRMVTASTGRSIGPVLTAPMA